MADPISIKDAVSRLHVDVSAQNVAFVKKTWNRV